MNAVSKRLGCFFKRSMGRHPTLQDTCGEAPKNSKKASFASRSIDRSVKSADRDELHQYLDTKYVSVVVGSPVTWVRLARTWPPRVDRFSSCLSSYKMGYESGLNIEGAGSVA